MIRRLVGALVTVLACALLAGCVAIPSSGGISRYGLRGGDDAPNFNFVARGPAKGADQDEILAGFIQAGIDTQDRYAVARQFLTTSMAARWNPSASVIVTDGSRNQTVRAGDAAASLVVKSTVRVDSAGQYSADGTTRALTFQFRKVRGEWRISSAPDGIVLSPFNFSSIFKPYPLYFVDPSGSYLVPDLRWFPGDTTAADRVVRGLLTGPAPWLGSGAVVTAFPRGTQLGPDGVTIVDGTATVDLSGDIVGQSGTARRRMVAQLQASLDTVVSLSSVRLAARGVAVDVPPADDSASPIEDPQVGSSTIAFGASGLGSVTGSGLRSLGALTERVAPLGAGPATIDRPQSTQSTLVLGTRNGVWRVPASGAAAAAADRRPSLVPPTIDPQGFVWSAQTGGIDTLIAVDPRGDSHPIASSSPAAAGVLTGMRLSRDGARIVFAIATPDGPALEVAAVLRDSSLVPTGIGPLLPLPVVGTDIVDLTWMDPLTIAYIARDASGVTVRSQQVGGRALSLGRAADAAQIVGGNDGADGLRVLTTEGQLLQQTGAGGWQATGSERLGYLVTQQ